jgi:hypothetical protein
MLASEQSAGVTVSGVPANQSRQQMAAAMLVSGSSELTGAAAAVALCR